MDKFIYEERKIRLRAEIACAQYFFCAQNVHTCMQALATNVNSSRAVSKLLAQSKAATKLQQSET